MSQIYLTLLHKLTDQVREKDRERKDESSAGATLFQLFYSYFLSYVYFFNIKFSEILLLDYALSVNNFLASS